MRELKAGGMGPATIARELKISQASIYRMLSVGKVVDNVFPIRKEFAQ